MQKMSHMLRKNVVKTPQQHNPHPSSATIISLFLPLALSHSVVAVQSNLKVVVSGA